MFKRKERFSIVKHIPILLELFTMIITRWLPTLSVALKQCFLAKVKRSRPLSTVNDNQQPDGAWRSLQFKFNEDLQGFLVYHSFLRSKFLIAQIERGYDAI